MKPALLWTLFPSALFAFALVAISLPASAHGPDPGTADALFQSGRDAMARGDFATACARFEESQRLDPAPGTLLNLAQCEEKAGKLATSYAHVTAALETMAKDDFRLGYAREQLAALKPRVPSVTLSLAKGSEGARVTRDDVELRDGSFGVPLPLDPGAHVFVVRADGHAETRRALTLHEGEHASLTLSVGGAVRADGPQAPGPNRGTNTRPLAIGAFAVGGVGIVTGIVTGLLFADASSTYRQRCDAAGCDDEGLSAAARAKTLDVVSPVAFGIGALGLGAGTYFLLTSKKSGSPHGSLDVSPQLTGVTLKGRF